MNQIILYRASGGVDFGFRFAWRDDETTWRIYIVEQPAYGGRAEDGHSTHRYGPPGAHHICWDTPIRDYEDARKIAASWAEGTMAYIASGSFTAPTRAEVPPDESLIAHLSERQLRVLLGEGPLLPNRPPPPTRAPSTSPPAHRQPRALRRLLERLG